MSKSHPRDRVGEITEKVLADSQETTGSPAGDIRRLVRSHLMPYRRWLGFVIAIMLVWSLVPFGFAYTHKWLIDGVLGLTRLDRALPRSAVGDLVSGLWLIFWLNMGLHSVAMLCHLSASYFSLRTGQDLALSVREQIYRKLDALHVGFHDQIQTGRVVTRMQHDVGVIQSAVTSHAPHLLVEPFKMLVGLGVLFCVNWRLSLIVLCALPAYTAAFLWLRPRITRNSMVQSRINSRTYGLVTERLGAILLVKAFAQERRELGRFSRMVNESVRIALRQPWYNQGLSFIAAGITSCVSALVLFAGLSAVRDAREGLTLGTVVAYIQLLGQVFTPIQTLTGVAAYIQTALVSLRRVFALLDQSEDQAGGHLGLTGIRGTIALEHVTFTYPQQVEPALDSVTFHIHPGERVAIMGPSGSGKSTIFQLLLSFYRPQEGAVMVGGINLNDADPASVRRHVRLVQQEPFLFSGTIKENIAYGYPDAVPSDIIRAATMAELHDFIMTLPEKYETEVGARGMSLSGGQRQRLSLATALLTNPEVLLLDDTTSSLDADTEEKIHATLNKVLAGRTTLVITQRISTARDCDRIIVLEQGRITQCGTHDQLMHHGFYGRICRQQAGA